MVARKHLSEGEQERQYDDVFMEYENWRADKLQDSEEKPAKKGGFTKLDFLFVGLGVVAAMFFRQCSS